MARLFKPTRPLLDEHGQPVIGPDGKVQRVPRTNIWYIRIYDSRGRAKDISTGTDNYKKALSRLRAEEFKKDRGEEIGAHINRITFDDAAKDIINDYTADGRRSLAHLKRRIEKHLKPVFGGRKLVSITTSDVRAFVAARLEAEASNAEINRELAVLKRMFTLAMEAEKVTHRPAIKMLKENNTRAGFFERSQYDAVRDALPTHLRPLATCLYVTGWRIVSEVLPLRVSQVDASAGVVRLEPGTTKNDEAREFPYKTITALNEAITTQLASAERIGRDHSKIVSHLFHEQDGSALTEYHFRLAWKAACTAAGCPTRIPHDFRRTAVRNLVRAGVPERVAMQMTGHKTRSVFERYNITSGSDLNDAAAKLDALLAGKPTADEKPASTVRQFKRTGGRAHR
jgi:integrase